MKREETVDFHIKAAWHAIARMYNAEAGKYNLTVSVGYILLNIDMDNGTPATKIAPLLGLEARSITRTLKNMEKEGFIEKIQDSQDKRFFRIFLTEKGREARKVARKKVVSFNKAVFNRVSESERILFINIIQRIHQAIDDNLFDENETLYQTS